VDVPVLEVRDLSVSVAERPILNGISLSILPGEVHVLLGPNGVGKTTLLMAVMGMPGYRVTAGRVLRRRHHRGPRRARASGIAPVLPAPPAVRWSRWSGIYRSARGRGPPHLSPMAPTPCSAATSTSASGGEVKRSELAAAGADPTLAPSRRSPASTWQHRGGGRRDAPPARLDGRLGESPR
jgi:Fe-S cluster assembly ATP-binding protein